jgi:hypothetical protein
LNKTDSKRLQNWVEISRETTHRSMTHRSSDENISKNTNRSIENENENINLKTDAIVSKNRGSTKNVNIKDPDDTTNSIITHYRPTNDSNSKKRSIGDLCKNTIDIDIETNTIITNDIKVFDDNKDDRLVHAIEVENYDSKENSNLDVNSKISN